MNKFFAIGVAATVLAIGSVRGQEAPHEYRLVSGIRVDLTPVIEWQEMVPSDRKKTPRPMPHWRAMNIISIGQTVGSYDECIVANEDKKQVKLFLVNLPDEVKLPIVRLQQIDARIEELKALISGAQPRASYSQTSGSVGIQRLGAMAQRDINSANIEMQALYDERNKVASQDSTARSKKVFAMFSGKYYAGLPIWDCGIRQ